MLRRPVPRAVHLAPSSVPPRWHGVWTSRIEVPAAVRGSAPAGGRPAHQRARCEALFRAGLLGEVELEQAAGPVAHRPDRASRVDVDPLRLFAALEWVVDVAGCR